MKSYLIITASLLTGATLMLATAPAMAHVDVDLNIGLPGVYVQPEPVYVQPRTVYVQERPVYIQRDREDDEHKHEHHDNGRHHGHHHDHGDHDD